MYKEIYETKNTLSNCTEINEKEFPDTIVQHVEIECNGTKALVEINRDYDDEYKYGGYLISEGSIMKLLETGDDYESELMFIEKLIANGDNEDFESTLFFAKPNKEYELECSVTIWYEYESEFGIEHEYDIISNKISCKVLKNYLIYDKEDE